MFCNKLQSRSICLLLFPFWYQKAILKNPEGAWSTLSTARPITEETKSKP